VSKASEEEQKEYSGDNFAFFALSFVTCVALPYTYTLLRATAARRAEAARKAARTPASNDVWAAERAEAAAQAARWSVNEAVKWGVCAVLWLAWLTALYVVLTSAPAGSVAAAGGFDPFKVLGISSTASDAEIKAAHKLMSRKW
jgi:preprotein translocase subunit Sec63